MTMGSPTVILSLDHITEEAIMEVAIIAAIIRATAVATVAAITGAPVPRLWRVELVMDMHTTRRRRSTGSTRAEEATPLALAVTRTDFQF